MEKEFVSYELVVVENGSTDNTAKILKELNKTTPNLKIITNGKPGKGGAVKFGMQNAIGDYRLFTDADNSTDISHIKELLLYAEKFGYDVVVSSRRTQGSKIKQHQPFHRELLGNIFANVVRCIIPLGIKDTQNGFKLFSRKSANIIFSKQTIYGWAFDIEILALAKKFNFKIIEVPITWVNDDLSKMNLGGMLSMLIDLFKIRWRLSMNYYNKKQS